MLDKHKHCVTEKTQKHVEVTSIFEDDLHYAKKQVGFQFDFKDKQLLALKSLYNCKDTITLHKELVCCSFVDYQW